MIKTELLKIGDLEGDLEKIKRAASLIRQGQVVAFPTETVYGLGANALDPGAVDKIFKAKGRPADNPLIVHIDNIDSWSMLVETIPDQALDLAEAFWPGSLTIILKKKDLVSDKVTAGLDTVAVRMPSHPVARKLIELSACPIAAPSANLSGKPSPTKALHVMEDMQGRIPMILDGGDANVGLESTVLDLTFDLPIILRPGGVTREMLELVLGEVLLDPSVFSSLEEGQKPRSPGSKYKHYAPKAQVTIYKGRQDRLIAGISKEAQRLIQAGQRVGILTTDENKASYKDGIIRSMGSRQRPEDLARVLFSLLREFDDLGVDHILAEGVDTKNEGLAVMNRLARAAGFSIVDL